MTKNLSRTYVRTHSELSNPGSTFLLGKLLGRYFQSGRTYSLLHRQNQKTLINNINKTYSLKKLLQELGEEMAIIMSNSDNLENCPFIKLIWENHHQLAIIVNVQLIHQYLLFAAKLVSVYVVIHLREKKSFEFSIVPSYKKLLREK